MNTSRSVAGAISNGSEGKTDSAGGRALRRPSRPVLHDPSKPPRRIGAVAFGTAEIFEHEVGYMESPTSGAPRLHQGKMVNHSLRRLDSLESEREPIRHHRESIQPLTPDERRDLATVGREMFAETVSAAAPVKALPTSVDAVLDNWHLGADGSIYHNGGVTSKVTNVDDRVVTTAAHGSRYTFVWLRYVCGPSSCASVSYMIGTALKR